jgi:plastocyanin
MLVDMFPRLRFVPLAIALAVLCAAAAPFVAPSPPTRREITMTPESYRPGDLTVQRGDTIVWRNTDIVVHSATSRTGAFDSGRLKAGQQFAWIARDTGRFAYLCTKHKLMRGTLTVR